jgi:hypothetical protein
VANEPAVASHQTAHGFIVRRQSLARDFAQRQFSSFTCRLNNHSKDRVDIVQLTTWLHRSSPGLLIAGARHRGIAALPVTLAALRDSAGGSSCVGSTRRSSGGGCRTVRKQRGPRHRGNALPVSHNAVRGGGGSVRRWRRSSGGGCRTVRMDDNCRCSDYLGPCKQFGRAGVGASRERIDNSAGGPN